MPDATVLFLNGYFSPHFDIPYADGHDIIPPTLAVASKPRLLHLLPDWSNFIVPVVYHFQVHIRRSLRIICVE
jgi:hypothetical protein